MAFTRRRPYPTMPPVLRGVVTHALVDPKYGRRGNARGKDTKKHTGGHGDLPNRPRKD